jgi:hypothetical protein
MSDVTVAISAAWVAAVLALAPDALARPRAPWRRSAAALALHSAAVGFLCLCLLAATGRVVFSVTIAVLLVGALAVISNAKHEALDEPFVFTDLSLFSQLFAHPRLYLPFLSVGKGLALAIGAVLFVIAYLAEAPRFSSSAPWLAVLCAIAGYALAAHLPVTLSPRDDQRRHGFLAVFAAYLVNGLRPATFRVLHEALATGPFASASTTHARPDVIVIQSESFFDARRLHPSIDPTVLAQFDRARGESVLHGKLNVPAWGANTMRTEFAVLTGVDEARLGYARFYPYAFVRRACASLAAWFAKAGYRTLAIHPYHADFFGRDRAFRHLGFGRFLDIAAFADAPRVGAFVSDMAVADAIIGALDEPPAPAFVFAVTMENHGPLHLEAVQPGESAAFHTLGDAEDLRDLTAYLRHLAHADAMIGRLLTHLRTRERDTVVCFYGDHVPAMSRVYRRLGHVPHESEFFIWKNYGAASSRARDLCADELGVALIGTMDGEHAEGRSTTPHFVPAEMMQEHD